MAKGMRVTKNTTAEAERFYRAITANVDAMYAARITFEAFQARQRALWDEIGTRGLGDAVQVAIRQHDPRSADYTGPRA